MDMSGERNEVQRMNLAITVRRASPADVATLGRLGALLVETHYDFDPRRFIAATPQTERGYGSFLGTQLDDEDIIVLVAERDGEVIGYTYAGMEGFDYMSLRGPAGVLYDIVVDPASSRSGRRPTVARRDAPAHESEGAPRVVLSTAEQNEPAQRLFAGVGFRRTMIEMTRELGGEDASSDRGSA